MARIIVIALLAAFGGLRGASAANSDPIVGTWMWGLHEVEVAADSTAQKDTGIKAKWKFLKESGKERAYQFSWDNARVEDVTLSNDGQTAAVRSSIDEGFKATRLRDSAKRDAARNSPATPAVGGETEVEKVQRERTGKYVRDLEALMKLLQEAKTPVFYQTVKAEHEAYASGGKTDGYPPGASVPGNARILRNNFEADLARIGKTGGAPAKQTTDPFEIPTKEVPSAKPAVGQALATPRQEPVSSLTGKSARDLRGSKWIGPADGELLLRTDGTLSASWNTSATGRWIEQPGGESLGIQWWEGRVEIWKFSGPNEMRQEDGGLFKRVPPIRSGDSAASTGSLQVAVSPDRETPAASRAAETDVGTAQRERTAKYVRDLEALMKLLQEAKTPVFYQTVKAEHDAYAAGGKTDGFSQGASVPGTARILRTEFEADLARIVEKKGAQNLRVAAQVPSEERPSPQGEGKQGLPLSPPVAHNKADALQTLEDRYAQQLAAIEKEEAERVAACSDTYRGRLDALQKQIASQGNLDGAIQVRDERARVTKGASTSEDEKKAMPPELQALRRRYESDVTAARSPFAVRKRALVAQCITALENLSKSVTASGDLDGALLVRAEKERIMIGNGAKAPAQLESVGAASNSLSLGSGLGEAAKIDTSPAAVWQRQLIGTAWRWENMETLNFEANTSIAHLFGQTMSWKVTEPGIVEYRFDKGNHGTIEFDQGLTRAVIHETNARGSHQILSLVRAK